MSKVTSKPSSPVDPDSVDPNNVGAWEDAQKQAKDAGIRWERPAGDNRSAEEIINDNPLLRDLGNQAGVRDSLEARVGGDIETDADAAYRAVQVLEHIERFDADGNRIVGGDVDNGEVNGFSRGGDAYNGTEAGRLQDFGKYGFSNLRGELQDVSSAADDPEARKQAEELGIQWERPEGDDRSAQDIIDGDPLLKNLGNQSQVKDMLKERVGDYEKDADAAYRASQVLQHVEQLDSDGNRIVGGDRGNSSIDGFTSSDEARHGTEAGRLQDFGKDGFESLKGKLQSPEAAADNEEARKQAEELGIQWERPEGDDRSAQDIIDGDPLLKNLGNQSGVKDMLKERVGDYEKDADAAYRASQVLQHVEQLDSDGNRIVGGDRGNSSIDGFTSSDEARHGTEAGRLQDFGKDGFSALKGKMANPDMVGDNKEAREAAEKADIKWELPEDDKRSAQDIIDDNPLLKNLGNQSGVKDMLKERVGDFEKDADAAYRAIQVLDRVTMYDAEGKLQSGDTVSNSSIDGFTNSAEARNGTEAGRLQDFGKYGFESLPAAQKTEDIGSYKDFLSANKDADETSKTLAKYGALLEQNYDTIKAKTGNDEVTAEDLKKYMDENPQIGDDFKEALNFWSKPGAFNSLETAADPLKFKPDGNVSKADISNWIKTQAPKDAGAAITFLTGAVNGNAVGGTDTSKLNKDIFENPDKYSAKEKAAALQELLTAQQLVIKGAEAGMWGDDYGKVSISNRARTHPDPNEILNDINGHISILESDPEVIKYLNENSAKQMTELLDENEGLKDALQTTYDDEIKNGKSLDSLWDTHTKDGKTDQQAALAEFYTSASLYQEALGIKGPAAIQEAVGSSEHAQDFKDFYEQSLASGKRLEELMETNTFEEAVGAFSAEVALYNATLDPEFTGKFDKQLNDNFNRVAQENVLKDGTFDDLKKTFGIDGGDELDEAKVKSVIEEIIKNDPELLANPDGTTATADQILAGIRGSWDVLRQGTKSLSELKSDWLNPDVKKLSDKGVLHGISGVFMAGVTIAKGAQSGGNLTERNLVDITTGSILTSTLLTEGGVKAYKDYLKTVVEKHPDSSIGKTIGKMSDAKFNDYLSKWTRGENAAKGVGGLAGIVAGAYGIFDGVQSIRKGDKVSGGISITAGSLGALAGLASAVEGGVGALGSAAVRAAMAPIAGIAGVLGLAAAGVGAIAMFLPGLIAEGKQQVKADNFGSLLGDYLTKYEIDGVPNGDLSDVPDDAWPETSDGLS
ncbi:type III effector HrpK [Phyllobacterium phragmitis]|uniref:Type III effector HrpK n=1 Tax=Phyllobacterium phragmitis TaxID=2670329 RepID=A0A2S9IMI3_9HYPH|nr:type III effector HrpK domain-containing protein [Phyllobacterium phragmitis]PRD41740.1 type III effector HrpK [Phyllobacterium phragmitis]